MYQCSPGWTVERMKKVIRERNNGTCARNAYGCLYSVNGNHCAVGCFIPDMHQGLDFIGAADRLLANFPDLIEAMPINIKGLLEMQRVHDLCPAYDDVRDALDEWLDENVFDGATLEPKRRKK